MFSGEIDIVNAKRKREFPLLQYLQVPGPKYIFSGTFPQQNIRGPDMASFSPFSWDSFNIQACASLPACLRPHLHVVYLLSVLSV